MSLLIFCGSMNMALATPLFRDTSEATFLPVRHICYMSRLLLACILGNQLSLLLDSTFMITSANTGFHCSFYSDVAPPFPMEIIIWQFSKTAF